MVIGLDGLAWLSGVPPGGEPLPAPYPASYIYGASLGQGESVCASVSRKGNVSGACLFLSHILSQAGAAFKAAA